jgi:siroheme synthase
VIYMPGQNYSDVSAKLRAAGLAGETPCAVISRATTPQQQTHRSTVAGLHGSPRLAAPTLLVVGEVVRFIDPVSLAQQFNVPSVSAVSSSSTNDSALAAARFARPDFRNPDFGANEEPLP